MVSPLDVARAAVEIGRIRSAAGETNRAPQVRAPRRPFRTETPAPTLERAAGDGFGFTTDPKRARAATEAEKNAHRRAALAADLERAHAQYEFHYARKGRDAQLVREASARIEHIHLLIARGEEQGRWS